MNIKDQDFIIKDFCRRTRAILTPENYILATDELFETLATLNEEAE